MSPSAQAVVGLIDVGHFEGKHDEASDFRSPRPSAAWLASTPPSERAAARSL